MYKMAFVSFVYKCKFEWWRITMNQDGDVAVHLAKYYYFCTWILFFTDYQGMTPQDIRIQDYTYDLPQERIAKYPLEARDSSKLLVYNEGGISETVFSCIAGHLPAESIMVFNDTKVVPARMLFRKDSGALIEIFCLEPHLPEDYAVSFSATDHCVWKSIIGNARKWKSGTLSLVVPDGVDKSVRSLNLRAGLLEKVDNTYMVKFSWEGGIPFSEVMEKCGNIPIPPYLNREAESIDRERYQTLYARYRGSVAAPTAGLHFTGRVLESLDMCGITRDEVCLHVGAGTFLPVKSEFISGHIMHSEPFSVSAEFLKRLYGKSEGQKVTAVGTTSVRTLESLYFLGVHILENADREGFDLAEASFISQWEPYQRAYSYSLREVVGAILEQMSRRGLERIHARTQIIIVPGYRFRVVDVMVTNFHQPQSTLLLLIAAFIGEDWRKVYSYALDNGFRFLSYGDSSLLFRNCS